MKSASFFNEFLANAAQVGSIVPSSIFLTYKMMPPTLPWHKMDTIAELGPGTGVFTRYIEEKRKPSSRFYLFEQNDRFRQQLRQCYPHVPIMDDALRLGEVVRETGRPFDLIVSGLPFANFPAELQEQLFLSIHEALADSGTFVAFQYTLLLKKKFCDHFPVMDIGYTVMNVPPAWVFRCQKVQSGTLPMSRI